MSAIAKFHAEFLRIHPFADGNGRTARSLLVQQCIDLLGQVDAGLLDNGISYQDAVRRAIKGDLTRLIRVIERAIYG